MRLWNPWGIGTNSSHVWGIGTNSSHPRKSLTISSQVWWILTNSSHVRNYSNSKTLEFPSTFIKLWYACEELESNAKCSSFEGYFIDVRNMYDCYMKFDYVHISHTREKYWYEIRDVLVPILHALWGIGTNASRREIYEEWNLRFNKAYIYAISWIHYENMPIQI